MHVLCKRAGEARRVRGVSTGGRPELATACIRQGDASVAQPRRCRLRLHYTRASLSDTGSGY